MPPKLQKKETVAPEVVAKEVYIKAMTKKEKRVSSSVSKRKSNTLNNDDKVS